MDSIFPEGPVHEKLHEMKYGQNEGKEKARSLLPHPDCFQTQDTFAGFPLKKPLDVILPEPNHLFELHHQRSGR